MANIDQIGIRPRVNLNTLRQPEVKQEAPATAPAVPDQTLSYFDLVNLADDLTATLRREAAKKNSPNSGDPFDRILDDEAEPKVDKLFVVANNHEIPPEQLLLQARAMFPDDSDLILVLREIIKRRKLKNENTDVLEEVMQQVWAESNEKYCKAGINVGLKAQLFAKKMTVTAGSLRETYRQFLTSEEGEISQYEQWVEQYGNVRRHLVAEFIETALLHDIQSHDPSCSREEFGALLNHVVNFKKLRSSDKAFMQVFLKGNPEEIHQEIETLACWFDCLQRPFKVKAQFEKNQLETLTEALKLPKEELQQKLIRAVRLLDGDLFFDAEAKEILLESLVNFDMKTLTAPPPAKS